MTLWHNFGGMPIFVRTPSTGHTSISGATHPMSVLRGRAPDWVSPRLVSKQRIKTSRHSLYPLYAPVSARITSGWPGRPPVGYVVHDNMNMKLRSAPVMYTNGGQFNNTRPLQTHIPGSPWSRSRV